MASKMPSMTALLGLLAIAGYQNRDKNRRDAEGRWSKRRQARQQHATGFGWFAR
jgi:hypothetical protein